MKRKEDQQANSCVWSFYSCDVCNKIPSRKRINKFLSEEAVKYGIKLNSIRGNAG